MAARFDLTDLRLFVAVVQSGSITRGAEEVGLALASASQRIAGLEETFRVRLLDRLARGVRPTEAGSVLLRHAQALLSGADDLVGSLGDFSVGRRARIRLLSNTGALLGLLPQALPAFLAAHPAIDVDVEERPSAEIVRLLSEGQGDLGIITDAVDPADLGVSVLIRDRLVLVAPTTHVLATRKAVAFADVLRERFVGLLDTALDRHLRDQAARRGTEIDYRLRLKAGPDVAAAVACGVGIAILPESMLASLTGKTVAAVPLADAWARRNLLLCTRDGAPLSPAALGLSEHLRARALREPPGTAA